MSVRRISELESGRVSRPRKSTVRLLADAFGLSGADRERFLRQAYESNDSAPAAVSTRPSRHVPRQLPAPPQLFTGRDMELAELGKVHDASTVVITVIDGMAGAGKTALAVQAAHAMVERYPDGQLFIDLHGYTDGVAPVEPAEALDRMLRALGVPGERVPSDLDERAGLYRSRLADQRVLIVLDNAAAEAQVAPLLPGTPGCVVLVTSRRRLVALDHTHLMSLDILPHHDAVALLRRTAGEGRLAGQPPDLVAELIELCGRLPLAIRIAAARLRAHPTWNLEHLVERLRDQQHRLVELAAGQRSVTGALDVSYQHLSTDLRRTYRLLGLHPGPDIDPYAVAALLDSTLPQTGQLLERLHEAHLLQEPAPGRYRFHDLVRAHAACTATQHQTTDSALTALDRLLDYYRHAAAAAMDAAYPYERGRRPQVPPAHTPSPAQPDPARAVGWLDSELPNLLAAASYATEHDRPAHVLHLSTILHRHLRTSSQYHHAETLHQQALTTAHASGDQAAETDALTSLGHIHRRQGRYEQATDHYQRALQLARATGHQATEMDALIGLGNIHWLQGRHEQATDHYQRALQLARTTHDRTGELNALVGLGWVYLQQGRYEQATEHHQRLLDLARALGNRTVKQAALTSLGHIRRRQGQYMQAAEHYQQLLDLAQQTGDRNYQFEAWQGLGRLQQATGRPQEALTHYRKALTLATELGQPYDQARAHDGLAYAHHALHQPEQALTHWQHALDTLTRLGLNHTEDEETSAAAIRTQLADLSPGLRTARKK